MTLQFLLKPGERILINLKSLLYIITNMKNTIFSFLATLLLCGSVFASGNEAQDAEKMSWKYSEHKPELVADDIPIFDKDNNKHYFEEYEGKTLLVVFWATWCSSCVQEILDLDILQKDFRKLPFTVIAISEDYQGIEQIKKFYKDNDIRHLDIYHDYKNSLFKEFKVVGMPTSFIITPEGKNVGSFKGVVNWYDEKVRKILLSHIPGNPIEPKNSYKDNSLNQTISNSNTKDEEASKVEKGRENGGE